MSPLTDSQIRENSLSLLDRLIARLAEALRSDDDLLIDEAKKELRAFTSPYDDLNAEAINAVVAADIKDLDEAVAEFARIADRIGQESGQIRSSLERARSAAQSAKKELIIPLIASTSANALVQLKTLKGGIDELLRLGKGAGNMEDLVKILPNAIKNLEDLENAANNIPMD